MAEREISPLDDAKLLGQAIANTESEIFREASDQVDPEEAEDGAPSDKTREDMGDGLEGQVEEPEGDETDDDNADDEEADETEVRERDPKTGQFKKAEDKANERQAEPEVQPKGRVPVGELLSERKARQAAEERATAIEAQASRDRDAMNARIDSILAAQQRPQEQRPQQQQPMAPMKPDMFSDPDGYEAWFQAQIEHRFTQQRVESSLSDAHEQYGENFVKAYQDLTGINIVNASDRSIAGLSRHDPIAQATVQRIMASPNPGRALMNWHNQQTAIREGGTPQFREKVEAEAREKLMKDPEFRKQALADWRAEAANGGQARSITRIPKSINDATGGTSAQRGDMTSIDDSDEGVFGDIWK